MRNWRWDISSFLPSTTSFSLMTVINFPGESNQCCHHQLFRHSLFSKPKLPFCSGFQLDKSGWHLFLLLTDFCFMSLVKQPLPLIARIKKAPCSILPWPIVMNFLWRPNHLNFGNTNGQQGKTSDIALIFAQSDRLGSTDMIRNSQAIKALTF